MKSRFEEKTREYLKVRSIPWVLGWIHSLYDDYEIDEYEENYLYAIADPEERFNSPAEYDWARDEDEDFTEEEIAEWDERKGETIELDYNAIRRIVTNAPASIYPACRADLESMIYLVQDLCAANSCTLYDLAKAFGSSEHTPGFVAARIWN